VNAIFARRVSHKDCQTDEYKIGLIGARFTSIAHNFNIDPLKAQNYSRVEISGEGNVSQLKFFTQYIRKKTQEWGKSFGPLAPEIAAQPPYILFKLASMLLKEVGDALADFE
jgi:hypothetical protein